MGEEEPIDFRELAKEISGSTTRELILTGKIMGEAHAADEVPRIVQEELKKGYELSDIIEGYKAYLYSDEHKQNIESFIQEVCEEDTKGYCSPEDIEFLTKTYEFHFRKKSMEILESLEM